MAQRLQSALRRQDVLGRWGGEEFLVLAPGTGKAAARQVAERMRRPVAEQPLRLGADAYGDVTISVGCATGVPTRPEELLRRADGALYAAKAAGRNNVQSDGDQDPAESA